MTARAALTLVLAGAFVALLGVSWLDLVRDDRLAVLGGLGAVLVVLVGADLLHRLTNREDPP